MNVSLFINESHNNKTMFTGQTVNASSYRNTTGEGNLTLYRNSTAVAYGVNNAEEANQTPGVEQTYNYTACFPESANYSTSCRTFFAFILSGNSEPAFQWQNYNKTNGTQYNLETIQFFANFTDDNDTAQVNLTINSTNYTMTLWNGTEQNGVWNANVSLGVGTWYFNYTAWDGALSNVSTNFQLNIIQNTSWFLNHTLNSTPANTTATYAATLQDQCTSDTGNQLTLTLHENSTSVASGTSVDYSSNLPAGTRNFTCFTTGNANYSAQSNQTFAFISKGNVNISLYLNGTFNNLVYTYPQTINAS
ncbi:MAG TPA: hypothetical protein VJI67_03115, partial [archaeon]|nr:hypothetical protein [archaeon]